MVAEIAKSNGDGDARRDRNETLSQSNGGRWRNRLARLIDIRRRLVHRLDHFDAAMAADAGEARRQRRVSHKGLDLAEMGDAHWRAASEVCRVCDQHDSA